MECILTEMGVVCLGISAIWLIYLPKFGIKTASREVDTFTIEGE